MRSIMWSLCEALRVFPEISLSFFMCALSYVILCFKMKSGSSSFNSLCIANSSYSFLCYRHLWSYSESFYQNLIKFNQHPMGFLLFNKKNERKTISNGK